jgi:hypothetical protein
VVGGRVRFAGPLSHLEQAAGTNAAIVDLLRGEVSSA